MEFKQNSFKLRHIPFSLSPTGDKHPETPQSVNFLNIFSIKDQNRILKKNGETTKYTDIPNKNLRESLIKTPKQPNKEQKFESTNKIFIKKISNHIQLKDKPIKKMETGKLNNIKSEKNLETRDNELMSNIKLAKKDKEVTKEKYKNSHENELKIFYYYRFHLHSLLINSVRRDILEETNQTNSNQQFLPIIKNNALTNEVNYLANN